jgi:hypothetical protein
MGDADRHGKKGEKRDLLSRPSQARPPLDFFFNLAQSAEAENDEMSLQIVDRGNFLLYIEMWKGNG